MLIDEHLRQLKAYQPGKPIEEVRRTLGLKKIYKLASNEIPFAPQHIKKLVLEELKKINLYPEADCFYLRKALQKKFKVKSEQIVLGNGSDEIIGLTLKAFVKENNEVIVGYPTFLIYEMQAKIFRAKAKRIPFKNYRYDLDTIAKNISKDTKIIFIANPDNPTGTYLTHQEMESFFNKIPQDILVYLDEAYYEFVPKGDFPRSLSFLKKRGNVIFSRTFSKAYGLAGLRVGYGVTTSEIGEILNKVREPFNVNRLAQVAACVSLENKSFLKEVISYINKEKDYLYQQLHRLGISFIKSATNFILIDFKRDSKKLYHYLLKRGVIVRELSSWGLEGFLRVTVGEHKANQTFIQGIENYLRGK